MSADVVETVFIRVNEYLESVPHDEVTLLWHGGEPLLLGVEFYRMAGDLQHEHCANTQHRIRHAIQTNLTLFRDEFVEPFRRLGITAVGTSYDPAPHVRGPGASIDSAVYNRLWMRGFRALTRNGFGWGLIYVVTRLSLRDPLGTFHFLTNLHPTGGFNMNPVLIYDDVRKDVAITPEEYVEFLGAIFPEWWKHRRRFPEVEPFRSLVSNIVEGQLSLGCVDSGDCTYHHVNVAPDGETSQCGRSADWGLLPYGNIRDRTLVEILKDQQRDQLATRVTKLRDEDCRGCRFWELCHGGCPLDSYSKHGDFLHKSEWCEAKRGFISKYFEKITGVTYTPRGGWHDTSAAQ